MFVDYKTKTFLNNIEIWNVKFPFDYQWRRKYNIPFGCEEHRKMEFFNIKFDIEEEKMFKRLYIEQKNHKPEDDLQLLKPRVQDKLSKEQEEQMFDDLDLDKFNDIVI